MTSPVVWDHAYAVASAAAQTDSLKVLDAGAQNPSVPSGPYWLIETASSRGDRAEMGSKLSEENGTIWLHLMMPPGLGTPPALAFTKRMSDWFRKAQDGQFNNMPEGLVYYSQSDDPPDLNQEGSRVRFSVSFDYQYRDILV